MDRQAFEDAIVARLKTAIKEAQIEEFPDSPNEFKPERKSIILVSYQGKDRIQDDNGRGSRQRNNLNVQLTFMYENRRNRAGVYEHLRLAENILSGFKYEQNHFSLTGEIFSEFIRSKNRWVYVQTYEINERFDNVGYTITYLTDGEGNFLTDEDGQLMIEET